jgi:hypothetical protein
MSEKDKSPPLPEPQGSMNWTRDAGICIHTEPGYTADQMRERDAMWLARLAALTDGAEPVACGYIDPRVACLLPKPGECVLSFNVLMTREPRGKNTMPIYTAPRPSAALVDALTSCLAAMDVARDTIQPITQAQLKLHSLNPNTADLLDRAAEKAMTALSAVSATPGGVVDEAAMTPLDRCEFALRDAGFDYDEAFRVAHLAYSTPAPAPAESLDAHIGNEFADMATNGIQWLRNVRDGISTPEQALAEMMDNYTRITALRAVSGGREKGSDDIREILARCLVQPQYADGFRAGVAYEAENHTTPAAPALPDGAEKYLQAADTQREEGDG